jgi:hypothetical protein
MKVEGRDADPEEREAETREGKGAGCQMGLAAGTATDSWH